MKTLKLVGLWILGFLVLWPENILGALMVLALAMGALAMWDKVREWRRS